MLFHLIKQAANPKFVPDDIAKNKRPRCDDQHYVGEKIECGCYGCIENEEEKN
jgi:hypothetical protein